MIPGLVALGLIVVLVLFAIAAYNKLVSLREQVRSAWAQIDVVLKRRYDLIPNLVETVKGYAAPEPAPLGAVISARTSAVAAPDPQSTGQAEGQLSGARRLLFAGAE